MKILARATELINGRRKLDHQAEQEADLSEPSVVGHSTPTGPEAPSDNTWQGRPGSLVDMFFGRDGDLEAVAEAFSNDRGVTISGQPGVGKTRLAAEYAHQTKAPGFWTTAGRTLDETLAALAPALYLRVDRRTDGELASDVRRLLEAFPDTTLWVIDDLSDADQVAGVLDACSQVRPLITMQHSATGTLAEGVSNVELEPLAPEAALQLLGARNAESKEDPLALELAEYVGRFPVALELLGGRIAAGDAPADLLSELRKTVVDATGTPYEDDESGQGGHILAAAAIALRALPSSVRRQLVPLGYTSDVPISQGLVTALVSLEGDELLDMFRACSRRSLLSWHGGSVRIQPAVIAAIPAASQSGKVGTSFKRVVGGKKDTDALEITLRRAKTRLVRANRKPDADLRGDIAHYERILARARTHPDLQAIVIDFVSELAVAYHAMSRVDAAIALTEESLKVRSESLGEDHPSTIAARNNLATVYQAAGRVEEAIAVHHKTLAEAERSLGPDHPTTVASRQNLATAHRAAGHMNEAVPLYERAVRAREKLLGPEHPDTLAGRNMLASAYQAAGHVHQAVPLYEKTLELRTRILGVDHPDTLETRSNLATAYQTSGRLGDALELYEDALEARTRLFGAEDRRTLTTRNNMATAYHSDGRLSEAMEMYKDTLEARTRTLGSEHTGTLTSRNNLASAHRASGNLRDALMMYEQNIADRKKILGPEHPKTLTSMNNAAAARSEVGNVEEAIPAFEEILEVALRVLGESHPISVTCTANLAAAYRAMGRHEDARRIEGDLDEDPDR
ncbi:MAG: tetratricopeptide repeat protein [Chloroflexi bacterium]|nr:tetratricopeptide repeat protein [Chloroflexota bacterium]